MKYELLTTIQRKLHLNNGRTFDRGIYADIELIKYLNRQNEQWNEKDCSISAVDYLAFKEIEYVYLDKDWYISNFVIETTENEYKVFCRYKQFSKEGDK